MYARIRAFMALNGSGLAGTFLTFFGIFAVGPFSIFSAPPSLFGYILGSALALWGVTLVRRHHDQNLNVPWALGILLYYNGTALTMFSRIQAYALVPFLIGIAMCLGGIFLIWRDMKREATARPASRN